MAQDKLPTLLSSFPTPMTDESEVRVTFAEKRIDNPGAGNCAFYAFAIGLIYIIQQEKVYGNKHMFDRWLSLDPSIRDLYSSIGAFKFDNRNKVLLDTLQSSLRKITYDYKLKELHRACVRSKRENDYQALVATSSFVNFSCMYYGKEVDINSKYNEYADSVDIKKVFAEIDRAVVKNNQEHLTLAPLYMRLLYGDEVDIESLTEETKMQENSPILKAMQRVKQDFFWGCHLDLDYLANAFEVNLHTLNDGKQMRNEQGDLQEHHTITVNNEGNTHWTTVVKTAEIFVSTKKKDETNISKSQDKKESKSEEIKKTSKGLGKNSKGPEIIEQVETSGTESNNFNQMLVILKKKVSAAQSNYIQHVDNIWFSFFHRHGETGKKRATNFAEKLGDMDGYNGTRNELCDYLENKKNGNTNPHSFRTMLLAELLDEKNLKKISNNFESYLSDFKTKYPLEEVPIYVL